ncbi:hypothetical protein EKE94_15315 [Mesobaculum littorinae]|uniref:Uncharacterized protein n=1 Tax=Mesobaculum littorinae TaxID=2486419 RepID=A0A438AEE0_9RHOB|nr:hypothetical protein [Mesobaculum littorinae]RVV97032.1 hypothetical protein EKE94_15315 [Mesobaculum littorinae]
MIRALAVLLMLALAAPAGAAERGLLWNRTGLPAVFPLQVKTPPGAAWRVTLLDAETGRAGLAAAFDGGAFFRVLVPPGRYDLLFEAGQSFDSDGFGAEGPSDSFVLERRLSFEISPGGRKTGHIVDLTERGEARVTAQSICQGALLIPREGIRPQRKDAPLTERYPSYELEIYDRYC